MQAINRSDIAQGRFAGYQFNDPALLRQALTHRSAGSGHYERLEFLGDSVVSLLVSQLLFTHWPKVDEGVLTRARAALVRESALAEIGRTLDIGTHLQLGPGELKTGGHRRDSILADAVEAVIGAMYLDAGFDVCRAQVLPWFTGLLEKLPPPNKIGKDPKTRLQEWLQARQLPLPLYQLLVESGEPHEKYFKVSCTLAQPDLQSTGEGTSRRSAEQQAAEVLLQQISAK